MKGADAEILETVHVSVPLPIKEIFAPSINVRVFDRRVLGNVLIGTATIPILPYLPWSKAYVRAVHAVWIRSCA